MERSPVAKAQGAVLTSFHVPLNEPRSNGYWLSIAIHHARAAGVDKYNALSAAENSQKITFKRLWWSCIIRDHTLALGVRRPIFITSPSFRTVWPPPTPDDLESDPVHSRVHSAASQNSLTQSLLLLCDFCIRITEVLNLLYPADTLQTFEHSIDTLQVLFRHTDDLNHWHDQVPLSTVVNGQQQSFCEITVLFNSMLHVYFQ